MAVPMGRSPADPLIELVEITGVSTGSTAES
jgi:hypothetical protein